MNANPTTLIRTIAIATVGIAVFLSTSAQPTRTKVSLQKSSETSTIITIDVPNSNQVMVTTPRGEASIFFIDGAVNTLEKGTPILPKITRSVIIPNGCTASVRVVSSNFRDIENISIAPSKGNISRDIDPATVPFTYGPTYQKDEFYPKVITELGKPYILRQYEGVSVNLFPLQYNPIKKTLRIYTSITVEVTYTKSGVTKSQAKSPTRDEGFSEVYKSQFINYSTQALRYTPLVDEGTMLIVCHPAFMNAMQPFVDWKNQRGIKTVMVDYSQVATSADALKTYVSNYYHTNGLTFLLLVGDAAQIPAKSIPQTTSSGNGDSDTYYGFLEGDDSYPEVMVGRFSAETVAHVTTMVNRTIAYEKNLDESATWIENAMGIASAEGGGSIGDKGESDKVHMENIRAKLITYGYTAVSQVYDPGASSTTVTQQINNGVGLINYVGHGADTYWVTTNFGNTEASALSNNNKWPFIFDVACVNGNFVGKTCFAEAFTRASNAAGPTGTVNIVASTINQDWNPPMAGQDNMIDILIESNQNNIRRTFGGIVANACMGMNDSYGSVGYEMTQFWTTFGDPSLMVRTKRPSAPAISHEGVVVVVQSTFDVSCSANGAIATLWQDGIILASSKVNNGVASLGFSSISPQNPAILTITGFNLKTYVDTIPVIVADKPFLIVSSLSPVGALLTKAEESLNMVLKNLSTNPMQVTNVGVKLRTNDSRITLIDSTETITAIGADPIAINSGFKIRVNNELPDLSTIKFTAIITGTAGADSYSNTVTYTMIVKKPVIKITDIAVDDEFGNNNGNIEPGEIGTLNVTISNQGHASALTPALTLGSTNTSLLEILATTINLETINPGESKIIAVQYSSPVTAVNGQKLYIKASAACSNGIQTVDSSAFSLGASNYILMQNGTVVACSKKLFDTGGPNDNYKSGEDYTLKLSAADSSLRVKIKFNIFETDSNDNLIIYDGPNEKSPIVGNYTGSKSAFEVVSSSSYLTLKFTSGYSSSGKGWDADILCITPASAPACPTVVSPVNGAENQRIPELSWIGKNADEYTVFYGIEATPPLFAKTDKTTLGVPLQPNTTFYWTVSSKNQAGESGGCPVNSFTTSALPDSLLMKEGSSITCNGKFFDSGGPANDYTSNTRETYTIFPAKPGAMVTANFTQLILELGYDSLYVWDGANTHSTLIGAFNSQTVPTKLQNLVASNASGALTFQLFADEYVATAGWKADIGCLLPGSISAVSLTITDGVNPIADATLTVGKLMYHTNSLGVTVLSLPYGTFEFKLEKEGYSTATDVVVVSGPVTSQSFVMELKRTLSITVKNSETNSPIYPASVIVNGTVFKTNSLGVAIAYLGAATSADWSITSSGFINKQGTIATTGIGNVLITELTPLHHIKIKIENELNGQPIKGGIVSVGPSVFVSATDGFAHLISATGTYSVSASAAGYIAKPDEDILLSSASPIIIYLSPLQHNITILVKESGSRAVTNATVTINTTNYSTDAEGKIVATLYTGNYNYTVSIDGFNAYQGSFEIIDQDITLTAIIIRNGIDKNEISSINIYPIPATTEITVEWKNESTGNITITNISGMQVIKRNIANGERVDVSMLNPGIYLAHLVIEGTRHTVKLIIQ
ncbi:C25 family cysteine peptidase [Williamwhitmania taraxaci]|uniref:Por secretion system C-terminal sorting domain-containing protein n=1 Tax=Williamwhitmania taraxaci TaxID=1640674 RepID=A0A1G6GIC5_9BACT|nr:C25 family cysteine peptidase [Williamwhitmania taraxaci]SDB81659.1 Por secretion system C-terminal sorting domain-containing protein [Williamwhitmania taraxaci]